MKPAKHPLGELELQVMELMWREGALTVRELWSKEEFGERAYTTMMTTMNRLHTKGLLCREKEKSAYRYWPSQERGDYWEEVTRDMMTSLVQLGGAPALTAFVDVVSQQDEEHLDRLEALVEQRLQARMSKEEKE
ncbi:MAG TPA: CopY family transcriptional regulator [Myxococcales bacterium]|nr:CopY family transcriptional regulator [Deltaproteobacteria bacterium]MBU50960.1 CopY family transcriptional regulator [Deltaproteobacteria bacterium]HAA55861.1 CopY family transcriptional regulator [Myxococcales bacterium]|tara:strand:- start:15129 stop:15533 length:405 start_codon:yes stop_codon:yes gene_type:complete